MADTANQASTSQETQVIIQRIYVADLSFESPQVPHIFQQEWKPEIHLDIHTSSTPVQQDMHHVVLALTVTVTSNQQTAFLIEAKQAGIFTIQGFTDEPLKRVLGTFCPNVLYPYLREVVTDVAMRGGFPQLILAPINFDALYQQHLAEQATSAG